MRAGARAWDNDAGVPTGRKESCMESWKSLLGRDIEPEKIFFVCTGNICRSAFAEEFSRQCMTGTTRQSASAPM